MSDAEENVKALKAEIAELQMLLAGELRKLNGKRRVERPGEGPDTKKRVVKI
jgi:hypothetical protein